MSRRISAYHMKGKRLLQNNNRKFTPIVLDISVVFIGRVPPGFISGSFRIIKCVFFLVFHGKVSEPESDCQCPTTSNRDRDGGSPSDGEHS